MSVFHGNRIGTVQHAYVDVEVLFRLWANNRAARRRLSAASGDKLSTKRSIGLYSAKSLARLRRSTEVSPDAGNDSVSATRPSTTVERVCRADLSLSWGLLAFPVLW